MSYVIQVETMDEAEFREFNRTLDRDPHLPPASRGTGDLQRLMMQQGRGR